MKRFEIPMVATSFVGLWLIGGLGVQEAHADFTFGEPVNIQSDFPFVDPATDFVTCFSVDGLEMYFTASGDRPGGYGQADTCACKRASVEDDWGPPENLGPLVNTENWDGFAFLSADGLALYFQSNRPDGYGGMDLYVTRRATRTSPWEAAINLGPKVNGSQDEYTPAVSPDGLELYLQSSRDGGYGGNDLYVCTRAIPDDPWGDGMVDAKDLTVLAGYIGKEIEDPTLVAHWAFDETEGSVAMDSAGDCEGTLTGGSTWQPQGGMVGGALKCDGVTGCVVTKTIPNLGTGPFSVIAWVKGGAPGQIILSHNGTTDWLLADPLDGRLMSKLTIRRQPLAEGSSGAVITDGKWHRIALVCDGMDQILYTDGREVLRDVQPDITVSDGQIMIGAGMKPGNLWSGLIDDVRIYNRVVRP